jgi:hypothetical protein
MRLLKRESNGELTLTSDFLSENCPSYAILSHTWGADTEEVSFSDLRNGTGVGKTGYQKILFCAVQAIQDGLQYFWVDTCCIDKSSSSELQEAITSMFLWYRNAVKCYVYLSDVSIRKWEKTDEPTDTWERDFRTSRWFTRSWTLQELIAPASVEFFSSDGQRLGDKISLERQIHESTGINVRALQGHQLSDFSISERMSWAVRRQTKRVEDKAYALFGIFGVFMPIIYGEGDNAFNRLQAEIDKSFSTSRESTPVGMRLLVAGSDPLRIETVPVDDSLQYAILSHMWGNDEVLFEDMRNATTAQRQGYSKIKGCCDLALKHGFSYVWVDTCCIDKSSSSELQEAICSMYKWYKNAGICFVYLEDCKQDNVDTFIKSRWFTRGWTLRKYIQLFLEVGNAHS